MALRKLCIAPGCDELAEQDTNRCARHTVARKAVVSAAKAEAKLGAMARVGAELYAQPRWRKAARRWREANPLCVECGSVGIVQVAQCVDHIVPHRGDLSLFWKQDNWQSLCNPCHSRKTAGEVFHQRIPRGGSQKPNTP